MPGNRRIYIGPYVHCSSVDELEICENGAIAVDEHGKIALVSKHSHEQQVELDSEWRDAEIVQLPKNAFFFPGFIG